MKKHKLFWGSSYDRGLDILLWMWGDIKERYPDAELHVCYGWDGFLARFRNNPERMAWKDNIDLLMEQDGITHHGRVSKNKLQKLRKECGIWAYPTYFTEINCITALEAQKDGCVPVVCDFKFDDHYTALSETVGSGVVVKGNISEEEVQKEYLEKLLKLMGNQKSWESEVAKGKQFVNQFSVENVASKWIEEFEKPVSMPKVTIITPTIRQGFWNVMADNISKQSYKNLEWIIVDDFPENRAKIADKYSREYDIDIRYFRGKNDNKRFYGLSSANNIAWKAAKGELMVWLQDFVLMPLDGIERLVDVYRHHPNDFIAPVDEYYAPAIKPNTDSEDWFNGKVDVLGKFMRKNIRMKKAGIRYSTKVTDLELNYGAIPKSLLEKLNGFWEFYDEALGYDDTEIVYRGFLAGAKLVVDDTNVCACIDHWEPLGDKPEQLGEKRTHKLNDPRYVWMVEQMENGKLPLKREQEIDDKIDLQYEIPEELSKDEAVFWMREHLDEIVEGWQ